jgi:hypothetical protein
MRELKIISRQKVCEQFGRQNINVMRMQNMQWADNTKSGSGKKWIRHAPSRQDRTCKHHPSRRARRHSQARSRVSHMQLGVMGVNSTQNQETDKKKARQRATGIQRNLAQKKWHICERKQTRRCNRHGSRQKMQVKGRDAMGNIATRA